MLRAVRLYNFRYLAEVNLQVGNSIIVLLLSLAPFCTAFTQTQDYSSPPKVIRKSGGVLQNDALKRVEPVYPPLARAAAVSGPVVVELTIDEEGNVIAAKVISGHPLLKDSALAAAKGWKFKPAKLSGNPVKVIGQITFNFTLGGAAPGARSIEALEKEARNNPDSAEARYELGVAYYKETRYEEAVKELKEAIRIDPGLARAHYFLGLTYGVPRNYAEAADEFKEAVRLDPEYAEAVVALGLANAALYRYDEAIANFKQGMKLAPSVAQTYFYLAMTYSAMGRQDDAISTFKEGFALNPDDAQAHYELGRIYIFTGDKKAAMGEYTVLKRLDGKLAEALLKEIGK